MPEDLPVDLPEGYYLENFRFLVQFVSATYAHLLSEDEQQFARDFFRLAEDDQKLFVRLSNRRGALFRTDRLSYVEIADIPAATKSLGRANFARSIIPEQMDSISLCTKDELLRIDRYKELPRQTQKSVLVPLIVESGCNPVAELNIEVLEINHQDTLALYRLLFFGNFHQDMTDFVLHELVAPYEKCEFSGNSGPFERRDVVNRLITLKARSDLSFELIECDNAGGDLLLLIESLGPRPEEHLLARRFDKTVNRVARQLERLGRDIDALNTYRLTEAVPSRERRTRIHDRQGQVEIAIALCKSIDSGPMNEGERVFARSFGNRLCKKTKQKRMFPVSRKAADIPQSLIKTTKLEPRVELNAVRYYCQAGTSDHDSGRVALYVENWLFRGLFGLCFWDIIFAPISGAFFNPLQRGPADLFTDDFVPSRAQLIDKRMRDLCSGSARELALSIHRSKSGIANHFVAWGLLDEALLETAIEKIPAEHLVLVFERMLTDLKTNASGLPDLIVFSNSGYELIEVKGPGDKLQDNQIRWFSYFLDHNIPASVVNVEYSHAD
ncbi:MAG: hypothetical protein ACI8Z1_001619 [Candidatus Azotimanducaceae bacterium]|jgi:hypothetical protein